MKIHTFYLTDAQRNNTAYLLGVASSKLREERNTPSLSKTSPASYDRMLKDCEILEAVFDLRHPGGKDHDVDLY